jgi:methionyl-tRNA synthetase
MARILITSAIPYINGIKHLGNLVGSQLPADLYARYMRARGARGAVHLRHRRTRHAGRAGRRQGRQAGGRVLRRDARRAKADCSDGFRLSFDNFGRSSSARRTTR